MTPRLPIRAAILSTITLNALSEPNIPDRRYVRVSPDGHLEQEGRRVRFWGFIGGHVGGLAVVAGETPEARAERLAAHRRDLGLWADRIADLGFNLYRTWERGEVLATARDYQVGDGSEADSIAYFYHRLAERGVSLWMSSANMLGSFTEEDVGIVDDPATADGWRAAVAALRDTHQGAPLRLRSGSNRVDGLLRLTDPRVEALFIARLRQMTAFPNKYKDGLALGDDPQVVVWEISNEEFPFRGWFGGQWRQLPAFFLEQIREKWTAFLRRKYADEAALVAAWGFLLPGESLAEGTVTIAPLGGRARELALNDPNPARWQAMQAEAGGLPRERFVWQRGADVAAFFLEVTIAHKQRVTTALRTMGKSCRLSPVVFDSGNDYSIHAAYMHQFADAVSTCSYSKGMGHDPHDRRFPFYSALDHSPKTGWDVPWFEQSRAKGKPLFVYETNIDARTKYRAEYPMHLVALASINDWDIICWHSASGRPRGLGTRATPFDGMLAIYHDYFNFRDDEVQNAAMRTAGEIFKNGLLPPAPNPTTFVFGRRSLLDPAAMDYGRSYGETGRRFTPTAFRHGAQVWIDPTREDDEIVGPSVRPNVYESNPLAPTPNIAYDRRRGHLVFDAPGVAAYTGFFAQYGAEELAFANGVRFSGVEIVNPPGMPYPVTDDERYVSLALASADGQPLAVARRALLSAVSTSFNTGYALDVTRSNQGMQRDGPLDVPPREFWGAWAAKPGTTPVLVARVGVTVHAPALNGMRYTLRDWHLRELGRGTVQGGVFRLAADQPVFVVEFERDGTGGAR